MEYWITVNEGYVELFINSTIFVHGPESALTLFFLSLARTLPIIALAPFFGAKILPNPVKVTFAICLFAIFLPKLLMVTTKPITFNLEAVLLLIKEVFIGFIIGYLISLPFIIVQSAGIIIDHQRGGASLMVNDPTIQNQSSPFGIMFNQVLIYLFYFLDAPFLILDLVLTSYDMIPPDQFINPAFFHGENVFWKLQIETLSKVMEVAIHFATPALLIMLMTDLFLGIANRLAPQVQITFLGMALKSLLGIGIVCIGWNLIVGEMGKTTFYWINQIAEMIKTLAIAKH